MKKSIHSEAEIIKSVKELEGGPLNSGQNVRFKSSKAWQKRDRMRKSKVENSIRDAFLKQID